MSTYSRRALLTAGTTGATAALAGCLSRAGDTPSGASENGATPEGTWPTFQSDTGRTGAISAGSPPTDGVGSDWEFSPEHSATASPVVSKDTVYVGDATHVYAVDRVEGSERWRFELGTPDSFQARDTASTCFGQGAFALDDEQLYVGSCTGFYALSREDGDDRWHFERAPKENPLYEAPKPTVVDGVVYVQTPERVYGLDSNTGDIRATYTIENATFTTSPTVVEDTLYAGINIEGGQVQRGVSTGVGGAVALDLSEGAEQWRFDTGRDYTRTVPTVRDGVVYVDGSSSGHGPGNRDYLFALDVEDGTELWRAEIGLIQNASPAVTDDTVYVGSMNESVQALSVEDGTEQWSYETGGYVLSSPAVCGDIVAICSYDNYVYGLDTETGDIRWQYDTGYQVQTAPAVLDGSVYIGWRELIALTE